MIVGVVVTFNSGKFLPELLHSIAQQSQPLDHLVVIDDNSTDDTRAILDRQQITWYPANTTATDSHTRVADNFLQGIRAARELPAASSSTASDLIVILGDHDDRWRPNRVRHQVTLMRSHAGAAMLASNGALFTENSNPNSPANQQHPETLRDVFPVPSDWGSRSTFLQWTHVIKHSVATGGASAIRPRLLPKTIPAGWLHDRWWSLAATRAHTMLVDPTIVIDYRVSPDQQVGLNDRGQSDTLAAWFAHHARDAGRTASRLRDLSRLLW